MENWFKIEYVFTKDLNITPLELDQMEFYRVEYMIQNHEEFIEEQEKQNKSQEKEMNLSKQNSNMGKFKPPKMEIPKLQVPKF